MLGARERGMKQSFDWVLVGVYLLLVLIGWVNIYSAGHTAEAGSIVDFGTRAGKQFFWILTALGLAVFVLFVFSARLWEGVAVPVYLFVLLLLAAVIFLGVEVKGSRSWFEFGPVRFQPAEISKISTSLMLAMVMGRLGFKMGRAKDFLTVVAVLAVPMMIILAEKETGSALVYLGFIFVMYREGLSGWLLTLLGSCVLLFILTLTASPYVAVLVLTAIAVLSNAVVSGRFWKWTLWGGLFIAAFALLAWGLEKGYLPALVAKIEPMWVLIGTLAVVVTVMAWRCFRRPNRFLVHSILGFLGGLVLIFSVDFIFDHVMQEHQRKRIEVLLGMKEDPSGVGYNVHQSMIAIGSGGVDGKGYMQGTQTAFGFVPEQSTDFIFCTVGEEWGFVGCLIVIALYVFMILRILHDAEASREAFTRIYGYCVAACIFMHLFINIGMTIGIMPVIGIPLPLLSYGGSSLWAFTVLIFIFIALDHQEKKYF